MRRIAMMALFAAVAWPSHAAAQTRSAIMRAMRQRQAASDSVTFRWVEYRAHRRDWLPNPRHPEPERMDDAGIAVERTDTVMRGLVLEGNRMRYRTIGRRLVPGTTRTVVDTATVDWSDNSPDAQELWLRALLLHYRPLDRAMGQRGLSRAALRTGIDERFRVSPPFVVLEDRVDRAGWQFRLWLDPRRDYVVRRYQLVRDTVTMIEVDVNYFRHAQWGWTPCGWVVLRRKASGMLWRSDTAVLTSVRINGVPGTLPAEDAPRSAACR